MFLPHYLHNTMLEMFYFTKLLHCCKQKVCLLFLMTTMLLTCRCGRFPPEVRTAIPVEGRFEHVVLSCSTTSDHAIYWIERESQKALEVYVYSLYMFRFVLTNFPCMFPFFWTVVSCWLHSYPISKYRPYYIYGWYTIVLTKKC